MTSCQIKKVKCFLQNLKGENKVEKYGRESQDKQRCKIPTSNRKTL